MDLMQVRRRMMLQSAKKPIDTSPKIAEYGKMCAFNATGERESATNCITEWYDFNPIQTGYMMLHYYIKDISAPRNVNYQYISDQGQRDWYYNRADDYTRNIGWASSALSKIRFTIVTADIDDIYAYVENTGQIFFAGRNTPYYGYTNINDMP